MGLIKWQRNPRPKPINSVLPLAHNLAFLPPSSFLLPAHSSEPVIVASPPQAEAQPQHQFGKLFFFGFFFIYNWQTSLLLRPASSTQIVFVILVLTFWECARVRVPILRRSFLFPKRFYLLPLFRRKNQIPLRDLGHTDLVW